jgi:hypothetical protein
MDKFTDFYAGVEELLNEMERPNIFISKILLKYNIRKLVEADDYVIKLMLTMSELQDMEVCFNSSKYAWQIKGLVIK